MTTAKPKYPTFDIPFPAGRWVLGSLTDLQTKDNNGRERKNPTLFVAVAIDKRTPGIDDIIGNIIGYTRHTYQYVNGGQAVQGKLAQPNFASKSGFSWKIKDGDHDPAWAAREGCRGCWIFCFGTSYAPARCCDTNFAQIDPRVIGLGDYVQVFCTVAVNGEVGETAGIYLNPNGVMFLGTGQRIIPAGQSFEQMFAGRVGQLPPGAQPPQAVPQQQYGGYAPQAAPAAPQPGYSPPPNVGGYNPAPAAPNAAYAPAAPAGGHYTGAPSAGHGQQPATAYPSSYPNGHTGAPAGYAQTAAPAQYTPAGGPAAAAYAPSSPQPQAGYPQGVQPNYNFVNGPQR